MGKHSVSGQYQVYITWTLDWTVDWVLDSIMDWIFRLEFHSQKVTVMHINLQQRLSIYHLFVDCRNCYQSVLTVILLTGI